MNGVHDMGGMQGFGPVEREEHEPVFHQRWEGVAFAVVQATRARRLYNVDEFRYAIERMDPARYLAASYYERWLASAETNLIEKGLISREELDARTDLLGRDPDAVPRAATTAAAVAQPPVRRSPPADETAPPRFRVGDEVIARNVNPTGHIRLPRYVRGKRGVIDAVRGPARLPDVSALGLPAPKETVYSVRFAGPELWGSSAEPGQSLYIDLWESYLDGA